MEGSCEDLERRLRDVGVEDVTAEMHQGHYGWTYSHFSHALTYDFQRTTKDIVYCAPKRTFYGDVHECTRDCKASLGAFTGICAPAARSVCLEAEASFTFAA